MRSKATVGPGGQKRIPHDALIVVCDGERSLFFKNAGSATEPSFQQFDALRQQNPSTREQMSDRPGRRQDGPGKQRSAVAETDHHQLEKERFSHLLADLLHQGAHEGAFQDLVLVAPPAVLGELRSHLHVDVKKRVIDEIDKHLTNHSVNDIQRIVLQA